jgi:hypothetical protein
MRIRKHKKAKELFEEIYNNPDNYYTIHYSSQGFGGRVTSIAVLSLLSKQTKSFSMHLVAEKKGVPLDDVERHDELEKAMLGEYFAFLDQQKNGKFIHWNMRNVLFGFHALEHRYEVLGGDQVQLLRDDQKIDLSVQLRRKYGDHYIGHPQMEKLLEKNGIKPKQFLPGAEEAKAFGEGKLIEMHHSTASKVEAFATIVDLAAVNALKTNATWAGMYGLTIDGVLMFLESTWYGNLVFALLTLIVSKIIDRLIK